MNKLCIGKKFCSVDRRDFSLLDLDHMTSAAISPEDESGGKDRPADDDRRVLLPVCVDVRVCHWSD